MGRKSVAGAGRLGRVIYELRYARPDELAAIAAVDGAAFGVHYSEQDLQDAELDLDLDTILVAVDGERIVGVSGELAFGLTLPGGHVDVTGLTWVSTEVTHRRQGIQRSLLERQVRTCAERGVAALILTASEGGIYGRYGFGAASELRRVSVDRRAARLRDPVDAGAVQRLSTDAARDVLPGIYERWRRRTPGAVDRNGRRWQIQLLDREHQRRGMSGLFHLVHPDGYVSYRIDHAWGDGHPGHLCWLTDYVIITAEAHAALWQTLLGLDLTATIGSHRVPLDDPLPHLLTDPRQVRTTELNDGLWVRPTDVAALLAARRYAVDVDVVLGVRDPLLGDRAYRLEGGPNGARCVPSDAAPDLDLGVAELGAIVLGERRLPALAAAGRVRASEPETITLLHRAFLSDTAPQFGTAF